jgi:hypothetical protein
MKTLFPLKKEIRATISGVKVKDVGPHDDGACILFPS